APGTKLDTHDGSRAPRKGSRAGARRPPDADGPYRQLFLHTPIGVLRASAEGRIIEANQAVATMLGYDSPHELIDQIPDVSALYVNPEDRADWLARLESERAVKGFETRLRRADQTWVWVELNGHAILGPQGEIL